MKKIKLKLKKNYKLKSYDHGYDKNKFIPAGIYIGYRIGKNTMNYILIFNSREYFINHDFLEEFKE
jgi:hypothetical protein